MSESIELPKTKTSALCSNTNSNTLIDNGVLLLLMNNKIKIDFHNDYNKNY